ncbi:hypothetical protein A2Y85_00320 [candidate division WOR-3 bacterium RBG_13_43_14]|uniref:HepT-like domain-containing protein n=1 Tax=candidate division WOR-3 bacterium RBG_13_43_14 TaxID=1802590 RepID=A0A1F4U2N2_UNCW3|nr:MAG: hypothetical protein A2Y85_00320 [candidate division WOR-3 bacterium RBG_13_43_14]
MRKKEKFEKNEIIRLIQEELKNIDQLQRELVNYHGNTHLYRRAKGSILHDFYNICERIFETICRKVNGEIPMVIEWHKKLLYQMTIDLGEIRPAVLSKNLAAELDEYLAFRHLFRNIYGFELESGRLDRLVEKFPKVVDLFKKEIKKFLKKL